MQRAPILEIRGVSYVAGTTTILDDVSWQVERGEHWAKDGQPVVQTKTMMHSPNFPDAGTVAKLEARDKARKQDNNK